MRGLSQKRSFCEPYKNSKQVGQQLNNHRHGPVALCRGEMTKCHFEERKVAPLPQAGRATIE